MPAFSILKSRKDWVLLSSYQLTSLQDMIGKLFERILPDFSVKLEA